LHKDDIPLSTHSSDKDKREVYDRYGEEGLRRGGAGNGPAAASHVYTRNFSFHPMDPFDLFRSFFGGRDPFGGDAFGDPFHTRFHQQVRRDFLRKISLARKILSQIF
jgi:DnaJ-class molecular chaperone